VIGWRLAPLSRTSKHTVIARIDRDPAFAAALLDEAATLFLNGEPETARSILRDLVNATIAFEPCESAVRIRLDVSLTQAYGGRAAINQAADRRTVALAEHAFETATAPAIRA
jgi:hypothetical protein